VPVQRINITSRHFIRLAVSQATKWQRIGNQIDATMIFARADFKHEKALGIR
jgi:hypothetical protein